MLACFLFALRILERIFGTKQRYSVKLDRTKKIWHVFLRVFWVLMSRFKFWKEDWVLGYVSNQIWKFLNISLFPKILGLKSFCNSWGYSYTKFSVPDTTFQFTCLCWNILKFQNIMNKIIWKFCFRSLDFQRWFKFLGKRLISFKKVSSVKELL